MMALKYGGVSQQKDAGSRVTVEVLRDHIKIRAEHLDEDGGPGSDQNGEQRGEKSPVHSQAITCPAAIPFLFNCTSIISLPYCFVSDPLPLRSSKTRLAVRQAVAGDR